MTDSDYIRWAGRSWGSSWLPARFETIRNWAISMSMVCTDLRLDNRHMGEWP